MRRLVLLLAVLVAAPAYAELDASDMQIVGGTPLAARGGVLMARLAPRETTTGLPATVEIALDDGTEQTALTGHL
ncbi:MAG TPA: hypothetical protein DEO57_06765, partial [Phycisphaerales bacterium]|nr:hypothetical protein [Phycisphaerales bacterium]